MAHRSRLPGVPDMPEVGGYVNRERALQMLGLSANSVTWLYALVMKGDIKAAYFDDRTLMYSKRSIEQRVQAEKQRTRR